ncbi:carboxypeptidase-like regulatory domain-containing protein, partial [Acinetobacter baumannii]
KPGLNIVEQSLPYDPSGTVYDAISRKPVANATVELKGPAGFSAASHLVGGAAARQQVTGDRGWYQFLLTPDAPAGVYELVVKQPAPYIDGVGREVSYADFFSRLLPPQATRGSCADEYCLNPDGLAPAGALYSVNRDNLATPPPAGRDTTYYVRFNLDPLRS